MEFRGTTAAVALAIGAITLGAGTVHAQPTPPDLTYSVKMVGQTVVTSLKGGTFETAKALDDQLAAGTDSRLREQDGQLIDKDGNVANIANTIDVVDVKDVAGNVVLTLPLNFRVAETAIPMESKLAKDNTVLELTPHRPEGLNIAQPLAVQPVASTVENQRARNEFASQFGLATAVGGFVGTAIGAVIGCVVTIAAGCLPGFVTGASIGGILGTIAVGGPTLIAAGIDYLATMQAADGTTRFADKPKQSVVPTTPEPPK